MLSSVHMFRSGALALLQCVVFSMVALPAKSDDTYPSKSINLIVPTAAGAPTDTFARILADGLSRQIGRPVICINKPGANNMVAVQAAQLAPADGHTLLFMANGIVSNQVLKKNVQFDIRKDVIPVARAVEAPLGLFVSNHVPANSVKELIEYAKKNPGKVNTASIGVGSATHLATERFRLATGLELVHIPYPGGAAPIAAALISGDVGIAITDMSSMRGFVADKRIKLLASLGNRRSPIYPDVPTALELGVPELKGIFSMFFFGIFVMPGTDPARVELLATLINKALAEPATRDRLVALGYNPALIGGTRPAEFREIVNDELTRVQAVVRDAKIPRE